jgi:hypothetical protein
MTYYQRVCDEMRQRLDVLPSETAAWLRRAEDPRGGFGIHRSQVKALSLTMAVLQEKQLERLAAFEKADDAEEFAGAYRSLCREIVAAQELWRVFHSLLAQRQHGRPVVPSAGPWWRNVRALLGSRRRAEAGEALPPLDAADLVAADCYNTALRLPRDEWGALDPNQCREPPLVYWEAADSPVTSSRGGAIGVVDLRVRQYRHERLPVPVIALPYDHAGCAWLLSFLAHEVGHNLDQDLSLRQPLADQIGAAAPAARAASWRRWAGEILADALGILFGGLGFALTLADLLCAVAPAFAEPNEQAPHPPPQLRLRLLAALLRQCGVPLWQEAIDRLERDDGNPPLPPRLGDYLPDLSGVARACLAQPLPPLGRDHALAELNPDLAGDARRASELARFFAGRGPRPAPERFPWRLVPGAARLALADCGDGPAVHARALGFLGAIEPPAWLDAPAARLAFYRTLVLALRSDIE